MTTPTLIAELVTALEVAKAALNSDAPRFLGSVYAADLIAVLGAEKRN